MKTSTSFNVRAATFIALFTLLSNANAGTFPGAVHAAPDYGHVPLRFEANAGQTDSQVKYISRGNGYGLYFLPTQVVLALDVNTNENPADHRLSAKPQSRVHPYGMVNLEFAGASANAVISPEETLPEKINYLIGNDPSQWRRGISAFGRVRYQNLYPGINLVFYGNQNQLEYDFEIAAHANVKAIQLKLDGADRINIETNGDLAFAVQGRKTLFHKPVVYQTIGGVRHNISGRYRLKNNRVSFEVGAYDQSQPLVIDPVLSYSSFLGGSGGMTYGVGVAVGADDDAYICGYTQAALTNLITGGAIQTTNRGGYYKFDCFVGRLGSTGTNLVYLTYLGGKGDDGAMGIAVDKTGNAYITGWTSSSNFPVCNALYTNITAAWFSAQFNGYGDAGFVSELNTNGSQLVFSTYFGSTNSTYAGIDNIPYTIAVDSQNNIYVAGTTDSTNYPMVHAVQPVAVPTYITGPDPNLNNYFATYTGFIAKFSSNCTSIVYSTYYGGALEDRITSIAVDDAGNLYGTGYTDSTDFPVTNAVQATYGGGAYGIYDAVAFKLDSTGTNIVYSTYLRGSQTDQGYGVAVDTNHNAYIVGTTYSANFPVTNAIQPVLNGNGNTSISDAFLTKLSPTGQMIYSTYLGGANTDTGYGVKVQSDGEAVIVGQTGSIDFAPYVNYGSINSGNLDGYVAKLSADGQVPDEFRLFGRHQHGRCLWRGFGQPRKRLCRGLYRFAEYPLTGTNVFRPEIRHHANTNAFITKLYFEPNQLGTVVCTTWQDSNAWSVIGPPAHACGIQYLVWCQPDSSVSSNGVTSLANDSVPTRRQL